MKKENPLNSVVSKFSKEKKKEKALKEAPENESAKIVQLKEASKKRRLLTDDLHENELIKSEKEAANKALAKFFTVNRNGEKNISLTIIEFVGHYLQKVWGLRKHTSDGYQLKDLKTKRYRNVANDDINRLKNLLAKEYAVKVTKTELESLIFAESFCLTIYDPLKSYFSNVSKKYDKATAEAAFEEFATLTYERIDPEKTDFEHWRRGLRVWLAFSYAQIFDPVRVNDITLVFLSKTQGTGKTMIANALAAAAAKLGLVGKPDFSDDTAKNARACTQSWILTDGECSKRRKADVAKFKDVLSEKTFSFVDKYEKQPTKKQRIASFIFCGNIVEYLDEPSRRETIIRFKEDVPSKGYFTEFYEKLYKNGLTNGIWAYAFYVWKYEKDVVSREREALSYQNTERSKDFLAPSFEDELVSAYFGLPLENSQKWEVNGDFVAILTPKNAYINLNFGQITAFLAQFTPPNTQIRPDLVRKSLEKQGFVARQKDRYGEIVKTGYRLRILKTNRLIDVETNDSTGF
jgi:predicted P-loop ATPase